MDSDLFFPYKWRKKNGNTVIELRAHPNVLPKKGLGYRKPGREWALAVPKRAEL